MPFPYHLENINPLFDIELTSKNQLINYMLSNFKAKDNYKIGLELEHFLYNKKDYSSVQYYSKDNSNSSLYYLLNDLTLNNWFPTYENGNIIELQSKYGCISLEPGGQIEFLSPLENNIKSLNNNIISFYKDIEPVLQKHNLGIYTLGTHPKDTYKNVKIVPQKRYELILDYYNNNSDINAIDVMKNTASTQINIDFSDEEDLRKKFRISMALQPIISALFANSPFKEGKVSKHLSNRSAMWLHMEKERSGLLKFAFEKDFNVEKYVDFALNAPIFFLYKENAYIPINNKILFKDYLTGKFKHKDYKPTLGDFVLHLNTLFPDVRIKSYLEVRSADAVPYNFAIALAALFVGLLYDKNSLMDISNLTLKWTYEDLEKLKQQISTQGLNIKLYEKNLISIIKDILEISKSGLIARKLKEESYLKPLYNLIDSDKTLAEKHIDLFHSKNHDLNKTIESINITGL